MDRRCLFKISAAACLASVIPAVNAESPYRLLVRSVDILERPDMFSDVLQGRVYYSNVEINGEVQFGINDCVFFSFEMLDPDYIKRNRKQIAIDTSKHLETSLRLHIGEGISVASEELEAQLIKQFDEVLS